GVDLLVQSRRVLGQEVDASRLVLHQRGEVLRPPVTGLQRVDAAGDEEQAGGRENTAHGDPGTDARTTDPRAPEFSDHAKTSCPRHRLFGLTTTLVHKTDIDRSSRADARAETVRTGAHERARVEIAQE